MCEKKDDHIDRLQRKVGRLNERIENLDKMKRLSKQREEGNLEDHQKLKTTYESLKNEMLLLNKENAQLKHKVKACKCDVFSEKNTSLQKDLDKLRENYELQQQINYLKDEELGRHKMLNSLLNNDLKGSKLVKEEIATMKRSLLEKEIQLQKLSR